MEEKVVKKSNVGLTIFVGIVSFIVGLGGCFVVTQNLGDKKENTNTVENNKVENCEKEEQEKFYDEEPLFASTNEYFKIKMEKLVGLDLLNRNINNVSELTTKEILEILIDEIVYFFRNEDGGFSLEDVNRVVKYYFGITIEGEDIYCGIQKDVMVYKYNAETKYFEYVENNEHGHGGSCYKNPIVINRIVDVKADGSKLTLKVVKAFTFALDTGYSSSYYSTMSDLMEDKNLLFSALDAYSDEINYMHLPEVSFNNIDVKNLPTYEYVFEYDAENANPENDNFVFVSYKLG